LTCEMRTARCCESAYQPFQANKLGSFRGWKVVDGIGHAPRVSFGSTMNSLIVYLYTLCSDSNCLGQCQMGRDVFDYSTAPSRNHKHYEPRETKVVEMTGPCTITSNETEKEGKKINDRNCYRECQSACPSSLLISGIVIVSLPCWGRSTRGLRSHPKAKMWR